MKLYYLLKLIIILATTLACSLGSLQPKPTPPAPDCRQATEPTQQDIEYALAFTGGTFESTAWQKSYTVNTMRVGVTWLNEQQSSLAYLEYLIYSCGYQPADLENYFSEQNFKKIIFRDYQNVQGQGKCSLKDNSLTLHEFTAKSNSQDYLLRYWVKPDSSTRVATMLLAYPSKQQPALNQDATKLFAVLPRCQE